VQECHSGVHLLTKLPKLKIMKRFNFLATTSLAVLLVAQIFPSCECQRVDCDTSSLYLRFLSKADDSDLFENGTYQRDSLRFFVMLPSATSDFSHQLYNWQNEPSFGQELLIVNIDNDASGYIFQYNSQERDTLNIAYTVTAGSDCCSGIAVATYGLFKGDTILPNASGHLILKK